MCRGCGPKKTKKIKKTSVMGELVGQESCAHPGHRRLELPQTAGCLAKEKQRRIREPFFQEGLRFASQDAAAGCKG